MSKFKVGDTVVVRRASPSAYPSKDSFDSFPAIMEGRLATIEYINKESVITCFYRVKGCRLELLEFELSKATPNLEAEAEWE